MKYNLFFLGLFCFCGLFAQQETLNRDSVIKNDLIYFMSNDIYSTTEWKTYAGESKGSATSRSLILRFRIGKEGDIMNIGRKGKYLKQYLIKDPEAYAEFRRAYKVHLRKKRICNTLEYFSYAATTAGAIFLFIGLDNYEDDGITAPLVAGGAGVVAGFTGIYVFKSLTDKHMDAFAASLNKSVKIYNDNLLKKCK